MMRLGNSFIQDPHSIYRELRLQAPAHQVEMWGGVHFWLVTRYDEARRLLTDPRLKKDAATASAYFPPETNTSFDSVLGDNMLFRDPPDHTRLRRFVTTAFTAHAVKRLRPTVLRIADELVEAMVAVAPGPVDLMQSLAQPLPVRVIGELLGVPQGQQDRFVSLVVPLFTSTDIAQLQRAQAELTQLLHSMVAAKRENPADDLLSDLVHLRDDGDRLSEEELLGTAFLLIVAGYETTVNLVGNGILALLQHPDQLRALRADMSLLPAAVEESLRFESPLNTATVRFTSEPVSLGEVEIPAGQLVLIGLLAANHDERRFVDADRFNIFRVGNRHLAFGHGVHHCIGAPLARLEAELAFDRLLCGFDDIELAKDASLQYRPSTLMRGLQSLPVVLRPVASPQWQPASLASEL